MTKRSKRKKSKPQRRNATETKARIVEAAQRLFGAHGYAQTGLREIAELAGVALSLLPQHFGSKAELFEAALIEAVRSNDILSAPRQDLGRVMVDYLLNDGDVRLATMVVLSTGDADARAITARVMRESVITKLAGRLGPPDARARAMEITMISTGLLIYGRQLPIGEVSERTKKHFAQLLQALFDQA